MHEPLANALRNQRHRETSRMSEALFELLAVRKQQNERWTFLNINAGKREQSGGKDAAIDTNGLHGVNKSTADHLNHQNEYKSHGNRSSFNSEHYGDYGHSPSTSNNSSVAGDPLKKYLDKKAHKRAKRKEIIINHKAEKRQKLLNWVHVSIILFGCVIVIYGIYRSLTDHEMKNQN